MITLRGLRRVLGIEETPRPVDPPKPPFRAGVKCSCGAINHYPLGLDERCRWCGGELPAAPWRNR